MMKNIKSVTVCVLFIGDFKCPIREELAITSGEWEVLGRHGSNVCPFILLFLTEGLYL